MWWEVFLGVFAVLFAVLVLPFVNFVIKLGNKYLRVPGLAGKAVIVTGCDSGFGRLLALKLLENGMKVFAGCFTENGQKSLEEEAIDSVGSLVCVSLDVTSEESVSKCAEIVDQNLKGEGLWGLVNNAGIIGPTAEDSFLELDHFKQVMDVNVYGIIRMVHAFKGMLKTGRGRIVNMSSCAGRVPGPGMGPYFMSKHAVEAYSDTIRHELMEFGVSVLILEPQVFKTQFATPDALASKIDEIWAKASEALRMEYGEKFHNKSKKLAIKFFNDFARTDTDWVVDTYFHALTNRFPQKRYFIGWEALFFWQPLSVMPTSMQDFVLRKVLAQLDCPLPVSTLQRKAK